VILVDAFPIPEQTMGPVAVDFEKKPEIRTKNTVITL
jgi:hypothetical protein